MPSLTAEFDELRERIRHGRDLGHASFEPVYYLVFKPAQILEVKRSLPAWTARLRNDGWNVHRFSVAEQLAKFFESVPQRSIWLAADRRSPQAWDKTNKAFSNALEKGVLKDRLGGMLDDLDGQDNTIVLVTDLEALHPYARIGATEGELTGRFCVPTVFFYPGERTGKTRLKFLGFYPEDGNYRSVHVGG